MAREHSNDLPSDRKWYRPPFQRYRQLWKQLVVVDGVLCRQYYPCPLKKLLAVPILPAAFQKEVLLRNHVAPTAGHQGIAKTLERVCREAYWVDKAKHVQELCR